MPADVPLLRVMAKPIRATLIRRHLCPAGDPAAARLVCFTSGNAGAALVAEGLAPVIVGPGGGMTATRWWTPGEIRQTWPDHFDATSGHLPLPLVVALGRALRDHLGPLPPVVEVPTGSGETILALSWAYPGTRLVAVTHLDEHTDHHDGMPLWDVVRSRFEVRRADTGHTVQLCANLHT